MSNDPAALDSFDPGYFAAEESIRDAVAKVPDASVVDVDGELDDDGACQMVVTLRVVLAAPYPEELPGRFRDVADGLADCLDKRAWETVTLPVDESGATTVIFSTPPAPLRFPWGEAFGIIVVAAAMLCLVDFIARMLTQ